MSEQITVAKSAWRTMERTVLDLKARAERAEAVVQAARTVDRAWGKGCDMDDCMDDLSRALIALDETAPTSPPR